MVVSSSTTQASALKSLSEQSTYMCLVVKSSLEPKPNPSKRRVLPRLSYTVNSPSSTGSEALMNLATRSWQSQANSALGDGPEQDHLDSLNRSIKLTKKQLTLHKVSVTGPTPEMDAVKLSSQRTVKAQGQNPETIGEISSTLHPQPCIIPIPTTDIYRLAIQTWVSF